MRKLALVLIFTALLWGQAPAASPVLDQAYDALRVKDYDRAIAAFQQAIAVPPDKVSTRMDLAYTLLKTGDTEAAREQFAAAMQLDPADEHIALEYAFLCYETKQQVTARRIFDKYRKTNSTAAQAFENVDRPLREGIARWQQALAASPDNFSGHEELARMAAQRDELALAAEHYEKAWRLRPARRDLLVDLGLIWNQTSRKEDALYAWIAASRGSEPRVAEQGRELLPTRYPYPYEFEKALQLDPANTGLRREFAYLQIEMKQPAIAEKQFAEIVRQDPADLLSVAQLGLLKLARGDRDGAMPLLNQILAGKDAALIERVRAALRQPAALKERDAPTPPSQSVVDVRELAFKSLDKGYMKDALKYLIIAHEANPDDFEVMLKLGWAYNGMKDDAEAVKWFAAARKSSDPKIASEAAKAYNNLAPALDRFRTTVWVFPTFSSRWHDLFAYAQVKTEWRWHHLTFLHPYLSVRFTGDTHNAVTPGAGLAPQYLSENAATLAVGMSTSPWHRISGWFEAGEQMRYRVAPNDPSRMTPDYRGGVTYAKGFGNVLAQGSHGLFAETNDDAVYVSRFDKDTLFYTQNRVGYTLRGAEGLDGFHAQLYWNGNLTGDLKRQYWANTFETGPGLRFRFERLPALLFSVNAIRGTYVVNEGNPRGANFMDLRLGVWYAFTR